MDNPEKTKGYCPEWTNQRKPKGIVRNGQSRGTYTIGNMAQNEDKEDKKQTTLKTNRMSNVDTTLN
jgi:hypothetical protein